MEANRSEQPYSEAFLERQGSRLAGIREDLLAELARLEAAAGLGDDAAEPAVGQPVSVTPPGQNPYALGPEELRAVDPLENARGLLASVEAAQARMAAGDYGWDAAGGRWIREVRLAAVPTAEREILDPRWEVGL